MPCTLTYPGHASAVFETYDGRGQLDSSEYGAKALIASSTHDLADRMTGRAWGKGIDPTYTHDPNGWLEMVQNVKNAPTVERIGQA